MSKLQKNIAAALAALALGTASIASQAHQGHMEMKKDSAACDSAKLSAWFERQRQLTEGDTDPAVKLATPDACEGRVASTEQPQGAPADRVATVEKHTDDR